MERILIVSSIYNPEPGISAKISQSLAECLSNNAKSVTVLAPFPSRPYGYNFEIKSDKNKVHYERITSNLEFIRLPSFRYAGSNPLLRFVESISWGWVLYRYIKKNTSSVDKVYMNTWPLFSQFGVAQACRKKGIPYIVHVQDVYPESFTNKLSSPLNRVIYNILFPIDKFVIGNASAVIVISEAMKDLISRTRRISGKLISVVINWQDQEDFEKYRGVLKEHKFTFMYLGNIGPVAGIPFVINSFVKSGVDAKLIIAGSGSAKDECVDIANLYPYADIEFTPVPTGKVAEIQSDADIFLLPLIKGAANSSIPSKLPAYMFSSKPIIASVDGGSETEKCIIDGNCGWVINPENEDEMIDIFRKVVEMPKSLLNQMGNNAFNYASEYFSKNQNLKRLVEVFNFK